MLSASKFVAAGPRALQRAPFGRCRLSHSPATITRFSVPALSRVWISTGSASNSHSASSGAANKPLQSLLGELHRLAMTKDTQMAPEETYVENDTYTDPQRFQRERDVLFRTMPLVIAHKSQFQAAGDYVAMDVGDVPVLVIQGKDNAVRAFINVCRHRGTKLVQEGVGSIRGNIVCPYHAWAYSTGGELKFVPHRKGFKECERGLVPLPLSLRGGFYWVTPTAGGTHEGIDAFLGPALLSDLEALQVGSHQIYDARHFSRDMNWKLVLDSALENYHVKVAHRETIAPMFLDTIAVFDELSATGHLRLCFPKRSLTNMDAAELLEADTDVKKSIASLRTHSNVLYAIFPNTVLLVQPDHIAWLTIFPERVDKVLFYGKTLVPTAAESDKAVAYWNKNVDLFYTALDEDWALGESIQRCLKSGANSHMVFGRYESLLGAFHRYVEGALAE